MKQDNITPIIFFSCLAISILGFGFFIGTGQAKTLKANKRIKPMVQITVKHLQNDSTTWDTLFIYKNE